MNLRLYHKQTNIQYTAYTEINGNELFCTQIFEDFTLKKFKRHHIISFCCAVFEKKRRDEIPQLSWSLIFV